MRSKSADATTVVVAVIATAGAVTGMYHVFTAALHSPPLWAAALCSVLELAMFASALRARDNLAATGSAGVDGAAVWVLAAVSAVLPAAEEQGAVGRLTRLALPLVAAWLWERSLAAQRRTTGARVAWRFTATRVALWLRLADPSVRTATDVDRARRLAALTRQRIKVAVLESASGGVVAALTARSARLALARWRFTRQSLAAVQHLQLGSDPGVAVAIRSTVAAVVGLHAATDPATLPRITAPAVLPVVGDPAIAPRRQAATTPIAHRVPQTASRSAGGGLDPVDTAPSADRYRSSTAATTALQAVSSIADRTVEEQIAWFERHLQRHPGRTVPQWAEITGLSTRTVHRRLKETRRTDEQELSLVR
jgi:hypothetical protein